MTARTNGQFPTRVQIDCDDKIHTMLPADVAISLAKILQCNCLISDDTADPYKMLYVSSLGNIKPVMLDISALDEHGEYNLDLNP